MMLYIQAKGNTITNRRYTMKTLGYRNGFRYMTDGNDIVRNDYADAENVGIRWYCTVGSFQAFVNAYGPLADENGNDITVIVI
jgi:hypothetical protein